MDEYTFKPPLPRTPRYRVVLRAEYPFYWTIYRGNNNLTFWGRLPETSTQDKTVEDALTRKDNVEFLFDLIYMAELANGESDLSILVHAERNGRLGYVKNNISRMVKNDR